MPGIDDVQNLLSSDPYQNMSVGTSNIDGFPTQTNETNQNVVVSAVPVQAVDTSISSRLGDLFSGTADKLKTWDNEAGAWIVNTVKDDYNTIKSAAGTVAGDLASPIKSISDYATNKIIIIVAVLAVGLYLVGKGGAVKANVIL